MDANCGIVGVRLKGGRAQDALRGFAGARVGGGNDLDGIVGKEEGGELGSGGKGLGVAVGSEGDAVVGDGLMDCTVFVSGGLGMADEDY